MEKTAQAFARNHPESGTTVSITRYGNVMYSRGSVIPLFVRQLQQGQPLTLTEPRMTRFLMSLEDSVDLVKHAFFHAVPGDLFVKKAAATDIGTLARAVARALGYSEPELRRIGMRHGEKMSETLLTREEVEWDGRHYRFDALTIMPRPEDPVPLMLGVMAPPGIEARIASLLHHPNIVRFYGVRLEGQLLVMELELLEGKVLPGVAASSGGEASSGDDTSAAVDCDAYCDRIGLNCTGDFTQYGSRETCMTSCAAFAPGSPGDMSGNNLACRHYHAGLAAMVNDVHCTHAGPGGDTACGSNCEGFCAIAGEYCPEAWADTEACIVACATFPAEERYDANDVSGLDGSTDEHS